MILKSIVALIVVVLTIVFNINFIKRTPTNLRKYYGTPVCIATTVLVSLIVLALFGII